MALLLISNAVLKSFNNAPRMPFKPRIKLNLSMNLVFLKIYVDIDSSDC